MATAGSISKDDYEIELSRVRDKILTTFAELTEYLEKRKEVLLKELDEILTTYKSYKMETEIMEKKKTSLEATKSLIVTVHEEFINRCNTELEAIKMPTQPRMAYFVCSNNIFNEVTKLGKLVQRELIVTDYTSMNKPVVSVCDYGSGFGDLRGPLAVTVDYTTGNIFVADTWNHCVKVFDGSGKIIYKFGDEEGKGKMSWPQGIAINGNNILISQETDFILNYHLNGKFISKIGESGNGKLEFNKPRGLTFNQNGNLFICDSKNNRVQILSKELKFDDQFGEDCLKNPCDVKLTKESICVLDESNPCFHIFNFDFILQKSVLSRGEEMELSSPRNFYIDNSDNILIADFKDAICIFNPEFEQIHRIWISLPNAVTVDEQGRIIVVSDRGYKPLNIF